MVHIIVDPDPATIEIAVVLGLFEIYLAIFSQYSPKVKALFKN